MEEVVENILNKNADIIFESFKKLQSENFGRKQFVIFVRLDYLLEEQMSNKIKTKIDNIKNIKFAFRHHQHVYILLEMI